MEGVKRKRKSIGTHSGHFHCDEATACWMLHQTKEFANADIVRTRDPEVLKTMDIVVDVGGVYDPATHRYDHHQRGFSEVLSADYKTKLSSAGLVYKHFGREVIVNLFPTVSEEQIELVYNEMYKTLIESLDASDNGIAAYPSELVPLYRVSTSLPQRVGRLNPSWNAEDTSDTHRDAQFRNAMAMTGTEFTEILSGIVERWLPARSIVERALASRKDVHESGAIVRLDTFCPWKKHLLEIDTDESVKFVLYCDTAGKWRVQGVPTPTPDSFLCRVFLKEEWRGLRDEELSKAAGVDGAIFIHASGFVGGANSFEAVLKFALESIEAAK